MLALSLFPLAIWHGTCALLGTRRMGIRTCVRIDTIKEEGWREKCWTNRRLQLLPLRSSSFTKKVVGWVCGNRAACSSRPLLPSLSSPLATRQRQKTLCSLFPQAPTHQVASRSMHKGYCSSQEIRIAGYWGTRSGKPSLLKFFS